MELQSVSGQAVAYPDMLRSKPWTLIVFTSVQCPYALAYFSVLERIAASARYSAVSFYLVNSNFSSPDARESLDEMRETHGNISIPFLRDEQGALARLMGATRTPECFVVGPENSVFWSGPVDTRFKAPEEWREGLEGYWPWDEKPPQPASRTLLEDVLDCVLAGRSVPEVRPRAIGCTIKFSSEQ
jgi:hypothetical protein